MPSRLPPHLSERVTRVNQAPVGDGAFVLYWMRVGLRGFENPALDAGLQLAAALDVPFLVVQGLTERYRFASARIHHFILEGAWDVAAQLAERGIAYRLHVERPGHRPRWLPELADQAVAVLTEDLPIEPLRRWMHGLAQATETPVWAVDTANVVPARLVEGRHSRAFKFRDAIEDELDARIGLPWEEVGADVIAATRRGADDVDLPFEPIDLTTTNRVDLVASCAIDHSVGPVPHTQGGSVAGYARWNRFLKRIGSYAKLRNNALKDGVSRMSAYLHFGMVAPTRLARESAARGGAGADKYLDELIVWRELAHHWCRHHTAHESLDALPAWARQTLQAHARDPREVLDLESLQRGQSGDDLWDAAQLHYLRHGELHNNVRMTWAKAIPLWTESPEVAARTLFDLNNRYSLDGRDPSSVGGLMWALGLFDRPFNPEIPILGKVRPRPLDHHARRLDVPAYLSYTSRSPYGSLRVAVVGAGPAGAMCARTLYDHGLEVTVFDKGRGAGGRCSTRRTDGPTFDHGTPAFTIRDKRVGRYARSWRQRGVIERWTGAFGTWSDGQFEADPNALPQFVGTPGMSHLLKHLHRDLAVQLGTRVTEVRREGETCSIRTETESIGPFDVVVVAVPTPQAIPLVPDPALVARLEGVVTTPVWALLTQLSEEPPVDFVAASLVDHPLAFVAREHTKPGRRADVPAWTVHATPEWTTNHLEQSKEEVAAALGSILSETFGVQASHVVYTSAHRWRFARVATPVGVDCLLSDDGRIGVCGDALVGGGVEEALLSGMAMAGRILSDQHVRQA
ncbi:MAG: FAD-dependent oxidoreductase [Myxococcota bacterium]